MANKFNELVSKLRSSDNSVHLSNDLELGLFGAAAHVVNTLRKHAPRIKSSIQGALKNGFRKERSVVKSAFNKATSQGRKAFKLASRGGAIGGAVGKGVGVGVGAVGSAARLAIRNPLKTTAAVVGTGVLLRPKKNPLLQREPEPSKPKPVRFKVVNPKPTV